jgi:ribonuclease Z
MPDQISRRDVLKLAGAAIGGVALAGTAAGCENGSTDNEDLPIFPLGEALAADQMRITFLGTSFLPRIKQECNSIFVELGNGEYFIFDCGSGISANYVAMGIPYSKMDKIFLTHLHGDHMSDLVTIYCFGPAMDRKTPLQIWGPSGDTPDEGTTEFCNNLKALCKWHKESFSFLSTGTVDKGNGYDIAATELPYMTVGGIAYEKNGVKITHFPAVHARNGSISYKLEWNGLSMVFSGDTRPNYYMLEQAKGVDVLIHETVVPPPIWASKNSGLKPGDAGFDLAVAQAQEVQDSSHTPETAFGYLCSQTNPRIAIATHFQVNDDTLEQAKMAIRSWYSGAVYFATDLLVVNVSKTLLQLRRAVVDDYSWYPPSKFWPLSELAAPKYATPTSQFNDELKAAIIPGSVYNDVK